MDRYGGGPPPRASTESPMRLHSLYRRTYPLRTLGMGLAALPVLVVLHQLDAGWIAWAWTIFCGFAWPHLAWLRVRRSADPHRAELTNFMIDSAMAGSLVPVMHFNLLPSVVLVTVATADKINSGVRGLWSRSLLGMLVALLVSGVLNGFRVELPSGMPVVLACLPLMVVHTLAVSTSSYLLIRRVQKQNRRLDDLRRHDSLTGLESRGHWQDMATALLARHADGQPASLLLVDVDEFKAINDRFGHAAGDDLLRGIADAIREAMPGGGHAGRLGGDEFAVVVALAEGEARAVAERIRLGVQALAFPELPGMQGSVSVGLASPPTRNASLRDWMEAADRALYQAKAAGRNRAHAATA